MQLVDLFASSLIGQRNDIGIELDGHEGITTLTFGDLDVRSSRLARLLQARGCAAGDRLAIYLANRIEFIDLVLACFKIGVVVVPINILYREREVGHILADAEPRAVVASADVRAYVGGFAHVWDVESLASGAASLEPSAPAVSIDGDAAAAIVYTSGTTGRSKGAVLSHNNFLANAANLIACWRITAADRYLAVLPLFHVHGLGNGLMTWLGSG